MGSDMTAGKLQGLIIKKSATDDLDFSNSCHWSLMEDGPAKWNPSRRIPRWNIPT